MMLHEAYKNSNLKHKTPWASTILFDIYSPSPVSATDSVACVSCSNMATQEALISVDGGTIIEKYCDKCAKNLAK
jgi:hypothetical protein